MKIAVGRFLCNGFDLFLWGLLHKKAALESYLVVSLSTAVLGNQFIFSFVSYLYFLLCKNGLLILFSGQNT